VFIRVEVGRLCSEQRGRRSAEFLTRSFVTGGPVPQEGGGLGRARTEGFEGASGTKAPMKRRCACRRRWSRKSKNFWLNYILAVVSQHDKIRKIHSFSTRMSSINNLYRSKFITAIVAYSMLDMRHYSFNPLMSHLLPARRYTSAGLCDSDVSVCPSVCPSVTRRYCA